MAAKLIVPFLNPDGTTTNEEGTLMEIVEKSEPHSEYTLDDGSKIKLIQNIFNVVKLDNIKAPNGDPIYSLQAQQSVQIIPKKN